MYKTAKPLLYTVYRTRNQKQWEREWPGKEISSEAVLKNSQLYNSLQTDGKQWTYFLSTSFLRWSSDVGRPISRCRWSYIIFSTVARVSSSRSPNCHHITSIISHLWLHGNLIFRSSGSACSIVGQSYLSRCVCISGNLASMAPCGGMPTAVAVCYTNCCPAS